MFLLSTRRRIIVIKTNLIIFNWWSRSFEIVFRYYKIDVTFGIILQNLKWYLDNNIVDIRYQNSYNISGIILTYRYLSCYLDMVLSGQCRQDSKFLETVTVATVRLETVRQ